MGVPILHLSDSKRAGMMDKILVVDDDQSILQMIKMRMESENFQVSIAMDYENALAKVKDDTFDLALVDLKLNRYNGIDLMEKFHRIDPDLPIIILTGQGSIKSAVEAMSKGACNYLTKPFEFRELLMQIRDCLDSSDLSRDAGRRRQAEEEINGFENIIGRSEAIQKVMEQVALAAATDSMVYINGESGTGKELIARRLHMSSTRNKGPFVAINCAAIPENLLENELFGHVKGAFTGAAKHKIGLFAEAHGGTFFLDEISEMPLSMQAKLLRVLEDKKISPLGSTANPVTIDARILAASNKNLAEEVKKGKFREDLFYRIHVISIRIAPLRERQEDIPLLANHFLIKFSKEMNKRIKRFSDDAMQKLMRHGWPGNVRELENAVEGAVIMADQDIIAQDMILSSQPPGEIKLKSIKVAKKDFEKNYLLQLLQLTQGNVSRAARLAGKYRADFYELLKKYNLKPADFRKK
jgi:two-component system response regulator GlrR